MQVVRYDVVADFYQFVEPFLLQHEAENNLPLGLLGNMMQGAFMSKPPYLAAVLDDTGQIAAAGVRTPPNNLILPVTTSEEALQILAHDVFKLYGVATGTLPGVLGTSANSRTFASFWTALTGQMAEIFVNQRIYRLDKLIPVTGVAGSLRQATMADYDLLYDWLYAFSEEAMGGADAAFVARNLENRLKLGAGVYCLWEVDGQPVCMVGYTGFTPNGVRIGPVYTPREYRQHGYGSACTAAVSQLLLKQGRRFCFLFTDLSNPTSNHIYQAMGYEPVCDMDEYHFHPAGVIQQG